MFVDLQRVASLVTGANKTETRVRLPIGNKTTDTGRTAAVYATFKVDGAPMSFAELTAALRKMGAKAVNVTLPRIVSGECEIEIQLRPVYGAAQLANVLEAFDATAKARREERAARAAGNIPIPAPAPDAPAEKSAAQRAKKGAKGADTTADNGAPAAPAVS